MKVSKLRGASGEAREACSGGTHQYSSCGGLAGDELAGPVLGLGHEGALELLFALASRFLLLLLGVVGRQLGLAAAAQVGAEAPQQHHHEPRRERAA